MIQLSRRSELNSLPRCYNKKYVTVMHKHIIINHDLNLHLIILSDEEEIDLVQAVDDLILNQLCHATEGVS